MSKSKKKKRFLYFSITRFCVFVLLSALMLGISFYFRTQIESIINGRELQTNEQSIDYSGLVIHYIDVGQGDAIAIEFPDNKKMLIDAGKERNVSKLTTYLDSKVFDNEENEFEYVLMTHSDEDHVGGMAKIFEKYQVNNVFRPQIYISAEDESNDMNAPSKATIVTSSIYSKVINAVYNEPNCQQYFTVLSLMNSTQKICGGIGETYYEFVFYSPKLSFYSSVNDYSPIMMLTYRGKTFLFTGDATKLAETEAIANGVDKVDILKVGHHGSNTSSCQEFLNAVRPNYAIIQVGADNSYGHPTSAVLDRLQSCGAKILRTDINQSIVANVNSTGELFILTNISDKVSIFYFIGGAEMVILYFCFCVNYSSGQSNKQRKRK